MDVLFMKKGVTIGFTLFIGGIILLLLYGTYLGFKEIVSSIDLITGLLGGIVGIGLIILIISIIIEQRENTKETLGKIDKEDLKP